MKLIVRADDVGYTVPNNQGIRKAIEEGIVTSVDLMLDCPGFEDAVSWIKEYPWLSVGWHAHFWGRPVLLPEQVPSMVNEEGKFKFRRNRQYMDTCAYDEVLRESRAQIERCIRLLGKAPDYTHTGHMNDFERARLQACREYGIHYGFVNKQTPDGRWMEKALPEYEKLDIYMPDQPGTVYIPSFDDSMKVRKTYNPVAYYREHEKEFMAHRAVITAWHPGYLDDYILKESSCMEARVVDLMALCSEEIKDWIRENRIELSNYRDVLYGSREYQNHLKVTGSSLYMAPDMDSQ